MSGTSGRNARILMNGVDVSSFLQELDGEISIDLPDSTTFGPAVDSKSTTPTVKSGKLGLKGFLDSTVSGFNTLAQNALLAAVKPILTIWPTDAAYGNLGLGYQADESSLKQSTKVAGLIETHAEFTSSVALEPIVSIHPLQQETIAGNGTIVDNGASTANGGSLYLEATAVGTTMTIVVHHSSDNFGADDTVLGTFTAQTVAGAQRLLIASGTTVKRYVRIAWTQTGNTTFAVGLCRK